MFHGVVRWRQGEAKTCIKVLAVIADSNYSGVLGKTSRIPVIHRISTGTCARVVIEVDWALREMHLRNLFRDCRKALATL